MYGILIADNNSPGPNPDMPPPVPAAGTDNTANPPATDNRTEDSQHTDNGQGQTC